MHRSERLPEPIAVFDSNIWFSAIHFGGTPLAALDLAFKVGRIVTSRYIRGETERTLGLKYGWQTADVRRIMNAYLRDAKDIHVPGNLTGACQDPNDDQILECAVVAGAQVLVTGDNDLLKLGSFEGFKIMKPQAYRDYVRDLTAS